MADVSGYDRDYAGSGDKGYAWRWSSRARPRSPCRPAGLKMGVFVNGRATHEVAVRECRCSASGNNIRAMTRQAKQITSRVLVSMKGHKTLLGRNTSSGGLCNSNRRR